tara:strand:+ start:623 stop:841 length:219 start_codon:yes stop_codon:yes gene_type:complete
LHLGGTDTALATAWLHGTVENCPATSFAEIEQEFGSDVTSSVREMTDDKYWQKQSVRDSRPLMLLRSRTLLA